MRSLIGLAQGFCALYPQDGVTVLFAPGDYRVPETVDAAAYGFDPAAKPEANAAALQKALAGGRRTVTVSQNVGTGPGKMLFF